MAHKWDSIGIQLAQAEHVSQLQHSPEPNEMKLKDILDAWMESTDHFIIESEGYINIRPLFDSLRSSVVGLDDVAKDLDKVCRLNAVCSGLGCTCTG